MTATTMVAYMKVARQQTVCDGTDVKDDTTANMKLKQSLHINIVSYAKRRSQRCG